MLEYLCSWVDRLDVIFRKTQADVDNAVTEVRQKRAAYHVLLACYSSGIQSASCLQPHTHEIRVLRCVLWTDTSETVQNYIYIPNPHFQN